MRLLKKMLSVFLAAVIMVSVVCTGTVGAAAAEKSPYTIYIRERTDSISVYIDGVDVGGLFENMDDNSYISASMGNGYYNYDNWHSFSVFWMKSYQSISHLSNEKSDTINATNIYFYKTDGDNRLTEGFTFTMPNNSENKKIIDILKKDGYVNGSVFSVEHKYYAPGQEGDEYGFYSDAPCKTLSSDVKIKEHDKKSGNSKKETATAVGSKIYDVVTASTPDNAGYSYIGQDLYYALGDDKVYKITDNDIENWKKTGKLNKTTVKLPSEMNGIMWNLYRNQNFEYSDVGLFYMDGKQILGKYNSTKNTITKIYSTENYCGISENGVIGEFEYNDKKKTLTLNLISSAGKKIKTLTFDSPYGCSWQAFTHGSKYCYVINRESAAGKDVVGNQIANTKLIRIDEKGNQKVIFDEKLGGHSISSANGNCIAIETQLLPWVKDYYYFPDTNKLEQCINLPKRYNLSGTKLYGNAAICIDNTKKYTLIDVKNQTTLSDTYAAMITEDDEHFLVVNDKGKYGFINKNGKELTMSYDAAAPFKNGYALVTVNGKSYFIDENMERVSEKFDGTAISAVLGDGVYQYEKNDKYYLASIKVSGNTTAKSISSLKISTPTNKTYTGKNRKATVTVKDGDYTLKSGTDYTLSYKNCKEIGTATVTIKGKGDYTGTKTLTYKIVPKKTTLKASKKSSSKVTLSWSAVSGAEKYQIYYSVNGGKYKKLSTVSGSKTSTTISKLDFEKNDYKFKIRSYGTDDNGAKYYSSFSSVKTVK